MTEPARDIQTRRLVAFLADRLAAFHRRCIAGLALDLRAAGLGLDLWHSESDRLLVVHAGDVLFVASDPAAALAWLAREQRAPPSSSSA